MGAPSNPQNLQGPRTSQLPSAPVDSLQTLSTSESIEPDFESLSKRFESLRKGN